MQGDGRKGARGCGHALRWVRERCAQGTVEYAMVTVAMLALVLACAALWRASESGALSRLAEEAASHVLGGLGALDIALY